MNLNQQLLDQLHHRDRKTDQAYYIVRNENVSSDKIFGNVERIMMQFEQSNPGFLAELMALHLAGYRREGLAIDNEYQVYFPNNQPTGKNLFNDFVVSFEEQFLQKAERYPFK